MISRMCQIMIAGIAFPSIFCQFHFDLKGQMKCNVSHTASPPTVETFPAKEGFKYTANVSLPGEPETFYFVFDKDHKFKIGTNGSFSFTIFSYDNESNAGQLLEIHINFDQSPCFTKSAKLHHKFYVNHSDPNPVELILLDLGFDLKGQMICNVSHTTNPPTVETFPAKEGFQYDVTVYIPGKLKTAENTLGHCSATIGTNGSFSFTIDDENYAGQLLEIGLSFEQSPCFIKSAKLLHTFYVNHSDPNPLEVILPETIHEIHGKLLSDEGSPVPSGSKMTIWDATTDSCGKRGESDMRNEFMVQEDGIFATNVTIYDCQAGVTYHILEGNDRSKFAEWFGRKMENNLGTLTLKKPKHNE